MKASKASGHSSSRSRKSSTKSPPPTPPDECFVPDQYGHHQYQPQYEAPPPHALSSAKPVGGVLMDQGRDVLKHLEAKESRMLQLTALLETMKEETAGTTQAMGRTLDENAHLHHLNQQLTYERQSTLADHEKQLQEIIQVFTDERRDLQKKFEVYIEDHLTVAVRELEMEKEQHGAALAAVTASMNEANAEKEELGKLLADTFRDLERCRAALVEANNNVARLTASLAQNDLSWTHTLTSLEKQIVDSNAQQQLVQDSLRAAESALQVERSQKEELNAAMRAELQRYTDELHEMQTNHANALALVISDRDECQVQLKHAQDQHNATEKQVLVVTRQFEEALHDAAHKLHAQSADSAKYRATAERNLAELNAQCVAMAQDLDACKLAKQASDAVIEALRASCGKLAALIGIDTSSTVLLNSHRGPSRSVMGAEALNKSLEMAYQAKASLQIEIDTIKTRFATLQSDHNDLQDAHGQLNAAATADLAELKAKLADAESVYQRERTAWDEQSRSLVAAIATLEGQATSLNDVALQAREDADTARHEAKDLADTLERTRIELVDVQDLCAEWKEKAEALAATSTSVESTLKADLTASSNQCLALAADKRRLESSLNADMHALRQEKQCISKHLEERDDELLRVQGDLGQVRAELERLARSKQTLQAELSRAADDLNDSLRQLEVEKAHAAAVEGLQKDLDALRHEQSETLAMNDELQAKISTIQSAANATINDLVAEVTHAEELVKVEQASRAKDDELLRSQCRYVEEDLKRKEIEWKDATNMLKRELAVRRDSFVTLETKYQKQKEAEVDKLTRENEQRQLKVAEIERKLAPLANIKETMTTRLSEMKLICVQSHDLEEKLRDEIVRLQKDKRDLESTHLRAKDEMDSSSAGRTPRRCSENKVLKSTLDRTKQELQHATENVAALAQRLDGQQKASQATIADLTSRMQTFDQQYQAALQGMSRELAVEKERTSELLAQKSQLLKQLRRLQRPPSSDESQQHQLATSRNLSTLQPEVATDQGGGQVPKTHRSTGDLTSYEDLANIPVALLRAQIGLDMFSFEEQHGSNQQPDGGSAAVPSLNLDSLNTSRYGGVCRAHSDSQVVVLRSTPYSHDMSSRLESGIAVEEGSGAKSKMAASKAKDVTSLKRLKKKMATKQSDDHASFKLKATESLPKLV
ncbi:hypothetical protein DYB32_001006 [Aphanomyces invadans]|uniref:Uncharacterized protein n=1 Tax=Aphanomyces invadans TaxID=157072 RepID=A0A3R7AF65_9STRA|nr:hypothetical protein DYB32_001006 [Aphanomyces invadans]